MKIVFTPDWFTGTDVLIETFSFIILFLFFTLCLKSYRMTKNRNTFYLGLGFFAIALAEIFTIFTKFVLYYDTTFTQQIGNMMITKQILTSVDIFYYIGFFLHKFFTLMGFYIIYKIPSKKGITEDFLLVLTFLIISAIFGNILYYVFHIVTLLLLILIIKNYNEVYKKNKSKNTKILIISFSILALSQMIMIISTMGSVYVTAQIVQVVSYIILLVLMVRITQHGKKKKP